MSFTGTRFRNSKAQKARKKKYHSKTVRYVRLADCSLWKAELRGFILSVLKRSVADPDPYVLGPPCSASGSVSHKYGSGSRSFHHQAKIVRKTLMSTFLWLLYDFLSLKNDGNVPVFRIRIRIQIPRIRTKMSRIRNTTLEYVGYWHTGKQIPT